MEIQELCCPFSLTICCPTETTSEFSEEAEGKKMWWILTQHSQTFSLNMTVLSLGKGHALHFRESYKSWLTNILIYSQYCMKIIYMLALEWYIFWVIHINWVSTSTPHGFSWFLLYITVLIKNSIIKALRYCMWKD